MTENTTQFNEDSSAVQAHLSIMQKVIQRMATNSRFCKTWCITLVSAILVFSTGKGASNHVLIAEIAAVLFMLLDTYYLALERSFRASYDAFVEKLHTADEDISTDLYVVSRGSRHEFWRSLSSFAIWPFYLTLAGLILLVWWGVRASS